MQETLTLSDGTLVHVADFEFGFNLDSKAIEIEQDDGSVLIEGYASDFDVDRQDEAFEPGAFQKALDDYMENPVLLYHHKHDTALGKVLTAKLDDHGLFVKALVDAPEPGTIVADYVRKIKSGVLKGFSVGGKFYRRMTDAGQRIFKCDLREISITPLPVNQRTLFAVAGKAFEDSKEPEMADTRDIEAALARLTATLDRGAETLEGKASQHPDGPKIAALQYHLQQIHTLAEDTHQNADDEEVKEAAQGVSDDIAKHSKKLHKIAARVGPLPASYGASYL